MRTVLLLTFLLLSVVTFSQKHKKDFDRTFQFSLLPALGTNGLHPGGYTNVISFNLTSGYSATTLLVEIAGISNLNTSRTNGLQFAGLANLTGANAFARLTEKEKEQKLRDGFEANLTGAQFSGITNVVLNNVFGFQATGVANVSKGALIGGQLAGIANVVYKYSFGIQLGGLFNISYQSMDGVQISSLANYTSGELYGVQIGALNQAGYMEGRNSYENSDPTGVQIGLINVAQRMNGFQIGLINKAKRSQGTQIGLINIYRGGKTTGTRDGTAIGLLNFGDAGYMSMYTNELFLGNIEFATGNSKNSRIENDRKTVYVYNALIYSNDPGLVDGTRQKWGIGYGLKKFYFTKSTFPGMGSFRFLSYGVNLIHVNHEAGKLTKNLSLVARPNVSFGSRLHPKLFGVYLFGSVSYSFYWTNTATTVAPSFLESSKESNGRLFQAWPGFSAGLFFK